MDKCDDNSVSFDKFRGIKPDWPELNIACHFQPYGRYIFSLSLFSLYRLPDARFKAPIKKKIEAFAAAPNVRIKCTCCHWNCWCACQYIFKKAQPTYCSAHTFNGIYFDKYSFNIHKYINKNICWFFRIKINSMCICVCVSLSLLSGAYNANKSRSNKENNANVVRWKMEKRMKMKRK